MSKKDNIYGITNLNIDMGSRQNLASSDGKSEHADITKILRNHELVSQGSQGSQVLHTRTDNTVVTAVVNMNQFKIVEDMPNTDSFKALDKESKLSKQRMMVCRDWRF